MSSLYDSLKTAVEQNNDAVRRVEITLKIAANTVGLVSTTYRVPSTHKLIVTACRGHIAFKDFDTENVDHVGAITPTYNLSDRVLAKAMNCKIGLVNNDSQIPITEGTDQTIGLADILQVVGGHPLDWTEIPHTVPAGQTVRMDMTLISAGTGILGGSTEYGVVLSGVLVRIRGD